MQKKEPESVRKKGRTEDPPKKTSRTELKPRWRRCQRKQFEKERRTQDPQETLRTKPDSRWRHFWAKSLQSKKTTRDSKKATMLNRRGAGKICTSCWFKSYFQ